MAIVLQNDIANGRYFAVYPFGYSGSFGIPYTYPSGVVFKPMVYELGFTINNSGTSDFANATDFRFYFGQIKNTALKISSSTITYNDFKDQFNKNNVQSVLLPRPNVVGQTLNAPFNPRFAQFKNTEITFISATGGGNPTATFRIKHYFIDFPPNVTEYRQNGQFENAQLNNGIIAGSESYTYIFLLESFQNGSFISDSKTTFLSNASYFQRIGSLGGFYEWNNGNQEYAQIIDYQRVNRTTHRFLIKETSTTGTSPSNCVYWIIASCETSLNNVLANLNFQDNFKEDIIAYLGNTAAINSQEIKNPQYSILGAGVLPSNMVLKVSNTNITAGVNQQNIATLELTHNDLADFTNYRLYVIYSQSLFDAPYIVNSGSQNIMFIADITNALADTQSIISQVDYIVSQTTDFALFNHTEGTTISEIITQASLEDIVLLRSKFSIKKGITFNDTITLNRVTVSIRNISKNVGLFQTTFFAPQSPQNAGYNVASLSVQNIIELSKVAQNALNNKAIFVETQNKLVRNDGGSFILDGYLANNVDLVISGDISYTVKILLVTANYLIIDTSVSVNFVGTYKELTLTQGAVVGNFTNNYNQIDTYTLKYPFGVQYYAPFECAGDTLQVKVDVFATQILQSGNSTTYQKTFAQNIAIANYTTSGTIASSLGNQFLYSAQNNTITALLTLANVQANQGQYFYRLSFEQNDSQNIFGLQRNDDLALLNADNQWLSDTVVSFPNANSVQLQATLEAGLRLDKQYKITARVGTYNNALPQSNLKQIFNVTTENIPQQVVGLIPFEKLSAPAGVVEIKDYFYVLASFDNSNLNEYNNDKFYFYFDFITQTSNDFVLQKLVNNVWTDVATLENNLPSNLGTLNNYGFDSKYPNRKGFILDWRLVGNALLSGFYRVVVSNVLVSIPFKLFQFAENQVFNTFKVKAVTKSQLYFKGLMFDTSNTDGYIDECRYDGEFNLNFGNAYSQEITTFVNQNRVIENTQIDLKQNWTANIYHITNEMLNRLLVFAGAGSVLIYNYSARDADRVNGGSFLIQNQSVSALRNYSASILHNINLEFVSAEVQGNVL